MPRQVVPGMGHGALKTREGLAFISGPDYLYFWVPGRVLPPGRYDSSNCGYR